MWKSSTQTALKLGRVDDAAIQRPRREGGELLVPRWIQDERRTLIRFMHDGELPREDGRSQVTTGVRGDESRLRLSFRLPGSETRIWCEMPIVCG
jgi:hypothetical protein